MKLLAGLLFIISLSCHAESEIERLTNRATLDPGYETLIKKIIFSDIGYLKGCLDNIGANPFTIFYTVGTDGVASEVKFFPEEVNAQCFADYLTNLDYPKPEKVFYGRFGAHAAGS